MLALAAAVVALIWFVCAMVGAAGGFPFLPLFLCLLAAHFAYSLPLPVVRR